MNHKQRSLLVGLLVLWGAMFGHFWSLNCTYAHNGNHITHPLLYIAVESWMLVCGAVCTIILYKVLGPIDEE